MSTTLPKEPLPGPFTNPSRIAHNVLYSGLGRAWSALLLFITIPIVVHSIGTSAFGIYALVSVVLGYVAFLDFGLTTAVVRAVSKYQAAGDLPSLERVVGTALTLLAGLGVLGAASIVAVGPWAVVSVFHVPPDLRSDAVFAFQIAALGFGCNMLLVVFAAVVQGLQRLDIFASRTIVLSTFTSAAQITAVTLGGGLKWLVVATIVVSVLSFLIFVAAARRLLPNIVIRPRFDRNAVRELTAFGVFRFISQASGQVTFQMDSIIIGVFQPVAAVAFYAVPLSVTQKFHVVEDSVASAYFPAAVELHSKGAMSRLDELYLTALKVVCVAMAFAVVICAGYANPILSAWVGRDIANHSSIIFVVLAVGYGCSALIGIPSQTADAMGHQRWTAGFAVASAIIQLSLALVLVRRFGPVGAALALVINTFTQGALFVLVVHRRFLKMPVWVAVSRAVIRPLLATLGLLAFVLVTRAHINTAGALTLDLVGATALFAALTLLFKVWTPQELGLVTQTRRGLLDRWSSLRHQSGRSHAERS